MNLEIQLVIKQQEQQGLPVRESPPVLLSPSFAMELTGRQRLLKAEVREYVGSLNEADIVNFAICTGRLAFVTAGTLAQFGAIPGFEHFAEAARSSIEGAAAEVDKALKQADWHGVRVASMKLMIAWYGIAANVGLPYGDVLQYLAGQYEKNDGPDRRALAAMLRKAGMAVAQEPGEPANESRA